MDEKLACPAWTEVGFSFAGWIECAACGFRPESQEEMDAHG